MSDEKPAFPSRPESPQEPLPPGRRALFIAEVQRSWREGQRRSQEAYARGETIPTLGLELHHCLLLASINSMSPEVASTPAEASVDPTEERAEEERVRLPEEREARDGGSEEAIPQVLRPGMAYALAVVGDAEMALRLVPPPEKPRARVEALTGIVRGLVECCEREQALALARTIENDYGRLQALATVLDAMPPGEECGRLVDEALSVVREIGGSFYRLVALLAIGPHLTQAQLGEALSIVEAIGDVAVRAEALIQLAPRLTSEQRSRGLEIARALTEPRQSPQTLYGALLPPNLPGRDRLLSLGRADYRADALRRSAGALAALGDTEQALPIIRKIKEDEIRGKALVEISGHLTSVQLFEALAIAGTIGRPDHRAETLLGIALALPPGTERSRILDRALATARKGYAPELCAPALARIVGSLPSEEEQTLIWEEVETLIATIPHFSNRLEALIGIAAVLPPSERREWAWEEVLTMLQTIEDDLQRASFRRVSVSLEVVHSLTNQSDTTRALLIAHRIAPLAEILDPLTHGLVGEEAFSYIVILREIATSLAQASSQEFYPLWTSLLELCSHLKSYQIHEVIAPLLAALPKQGGRQSVEDLWHALKALTQLE